MIFLAPMHGFTDYVFRNVYSRHYSGIDFAVSPFISLVHGFYGKSVIAKDVLPTNNAAIPVIPQLLGNDTEQFIQMANVLHSWGYEQINWNLGCPVKNVIRKKRGSGLLAYPELLNEILEKIIPNIPLHLSIKLRLGLNTTDEIFQIIPVLNNFPLKNIIIHPRVASQMYQGEIHHDVLQQCIPLLKHEIIYNGDITSINDFTAIKKRYPEIKKWMIGRAVFYNPLLPSLINGIQQPDTEKDKEIFLVFLLDLYSEMRKYKTETQFLHKAKDLWSLFCKRFSNSEMVFSQIAHTQSPEELISITKEINENCSVNINSCNTIS